MTALIPGTDAHGQNYIFRPESANDGILDRSASLSRIPCIALYHMFFAFDDPSLCLLMITHVALLLLACVCGCCMVASSSAWPPLANYARHLSLGDNLVLHFPLQVTMNVLHGCY